MMLKILLSSILLFGISTGAIADSARDILENKNIENRNVVLPNLDFKTVMMAFYQKQIQFVKIPELEHEKVQYVGIKKTQEDDSPKENSVLIFSSAKTYQNINNETRYLLTIAKFAISGLNSPLVEMGKFEFSETEVYIFKKNEKGQFQLLSQSSEPLVNDDFVYLPYSTDKIIKNIKNIGSKIKGYVEEYEYSENGYSSTKLKIMPFDEKPFFLSLEVAEIGNNNDATDNEKNYNTQGKYRFLTSEHDGLYDIEIRYSGTKKGGVGDAKKIVPVRETHIYQYNEKLQKYLRVN